MTLRDRMLVGNPILNALIPVFDALIAAVNALGSVVFTGEAPHKVDDTADAVLTADSFDLDTVGNLETALDVAYVAHIASTSYHIAADSTNTLTATTVYAKCKALADDLKAKFNLHRVMTASSVHAGSGDANAVTAAAMTTKALGITLLNDIRTMMIAHLANVTTCHGAADTTSMAAVPVALTSTATWTQIAAMADALRAAYVLHVALTAGSVHGAADTTHNPAVAAVGAVQTSVNTYLSELKTDLNAHIILLTSHYVKDDSMKVSAAAATTLATSITLANAIKVAFNDHISRAAEVALTVPTLDEL